MRFKKPLDIFWPQIQWKKKFRRIFSYDFGFKKKSVGDFLALSSSWKRASYAYLIHDFQSLWTCFTELYLFYWFLVVPLAIFIAAPVVFSRT